jgi:isoquinoline 1-oxidoreductase subunit beta
MTVLTDRQRDEGGRISRRAFMASALAAGGALVIGITVRGRLHINYAKQSADDPFSTWIHIHQDGRTEVVLNKSEMGQGVYTSLPMILAEEAELDWNRVSVVQSDDSQGTGGSGSVYHSYEPLRRAGAVVREAMIAAAGRRWQVATADCFAKNSRVFQRTSGQSLSYGELVTDARMHPLPQIKDVRLKEKKDFTLIGRHVPHLDIPAKVKGEARYGIDVRVPGMLFAVVAQCPMLSGKLLSVDDSKARIVAGVVDVFRIPSDRSGAEVAVVGDTTWAAIQGRKALELKWQAGAYRNESTASLTAKFVRALDGKEYWNWSNTTLNPDQVPAATRVESIYQCPFVAHTTLEPMNTTVLLRSGKCEVWAPTQSGGDTREGIAKALGIPQKDVIVHVTFMGGGFGRRFGGDFDTQAAHVAKRMMRPIQLVWTREDDFVHDEFRPAFMHRLRAGLDKQGNIVAWSDRLVDTTIIGQDDPKQAQLFEMPGAVDMPYPSQHIRVSYTPVDSGVVRGVWRGVPIAMNVFAVESFIDELAHAAGEDPYLYRRRLFTIAARETAGRVPVKRSGADWPQPDPMRMIKVLDVASQKAGWGTHLKPNHGRGISCYRSVDSYLAQVAEVTVDNGAIKVTRLITAVDCGQVVNMNGLTAQIEGGVLFGLSAALKEKITVKDGAIEQVNFNQYDPLRMHEAPQLETYIVESDHRPGGMGEPPVALPAPSVANAIYSATGKRLRRQPFSVTNEETV